MRFLKYVVGVVALELDEQGNIVGEKTSEPRACYTDEQLLALVKEVRETFVEGDLNGRGPDDNVADQLRQRSLSGQQPGSG